MKWTTLTFKQLAQQKTLRMDAKYWLKRQAASDKQQATSLPQSCGTAAGNRKEKMSAIKKDRKQKLLQHDIAQELESLTFEELIHLAMEINEFYTKQFYKMEAGGQCCASRLHPTKLASLRPAEIYTHKIIL